MTLAHALAALAALCLLLGIALRWMAARERGELGLPPGEVLLADTGEERGSPLVARSIALRGRPDLLLRDGNMVVPVEVKTGRTPDEPHRGRVMQLMAYCLLVAETEGVRPEYGILRHPDREFRIAYDARNERDLRELLSAMLVEKVAGRGQHRSHRPTRRCGACSLRDRREEQLEIE
jgi:CRISPR/Cas system-associated exonuclease Cas4 (RecB family)